MPYRFFLDAGYPPVNDRDSSSPSSTNPDWSNDYPDLPLYSQMMGGVGPGREGEGLPRHRGNQRPGMGEDMRYFGGANLDEDDLGQAEKDEIADWVRRHGAEMQGGLADNLLEDQKTVDGESVPDGMLIPC